MDMEQQTNRTGNIQDQFQDKVMLYVKMVTVNNPFISLFFFFAFA